MTSPFEHLRAAAPSTVVDPAVKAAAYHRAVSTPVGSIRTDPRLTRWWISAIVSVSAATAMFAAPAAVAGDRGPSAPVPGSAESSAVFQPDGIHLWLTHSDGTVYEITPTPLGNAAAPGGHS
jgi:hypothetical protein